MKGYLHQKQVRCKLSPRWQLLFFFFLNLNDKALEVLGAMICPLLLLQWEPERSQQAPGSCRGEGWRELPACSLHPAQPPTGTKAGLIHSQLPRMRTRARHGSATSTAPSAVHRSAPCAAPAVLWNFETCNRSHDSRHFREERRTACQQPRNSGHDPSFLASSCGMLL